MGFDNFRTVYYKEYEDQIKISDNKNDDKLNGDESKPIAFNVLCALILNNPIISDTTCDVTKIRYLNLSACGLDEIPNCIDKLNLVHLNVAHNSLTVVPRCLYWGLNCLESLDMSFNHLTNFDIEPGCVYHLKYLRLNNNRFTDMPKWIREFRGVNLLEIDYSSNNSQCKHVDNKHNLNVTKLRRLELRNAHLVDDDCNVLKSIKSLDYLDVSNELGGSRRLLNIFHNLEVLFVNPLWRNMTVLKLNNLFLSIVPEGIMRLASLQELHVTKNCLSWIPNEIQFLVNLVVLDISDNEIIALPPQIMALEHLQVIKAASNLIQDAPDLAILPKLQWLDLFDNHLEQITFDTANIECIDLESNYFDTVCIGCNYNDRKTRLRSDLIVQRIDGTKPAVDDHISESSETTDEDLNVLDYCEGHCEIIDENWDMDDVRQGHPGVTASDNEWQGEEDSRSSSRSLRGSLTKLTGRQNVDEDWMFWDVEETMQP